MGRLWVLALVLGGCYEPPAICGIACETTCPDGYACTDHQCVPADGTECPAPPQIEFAEVHTGAYFACARDTGGAVYCWGDNRLGQIAQTISDTPYPHPTKVGDGFDSLSVGSTHACGLRKGIATCWGENQSGQVAGGSGGTLGVTDVVVPAGTPAFTQISAGGNATCAIGANGSLWCWGDPTTLGVQSRTQAQQIGSDLDWTQVSVGMNQVCGIRAGAVYCWGTNDAAQVQLPPGNAIATPALVPVGNGNAALYVNAGQYLSCAIIASAPGATSGSLHCWGYNDGHFQIRLTQVIEYLAPTQVGTDTDWTKVRVGHGVTCGIRSGNAYCWGYATSGGLGVGFWDHRFAYGDPAMVTLGPADFIEFNIGSPSPRDWAELGCLHNGNKVACWGRNVVGQLGLGTVSVHPSPTQVPSPVDGHVWKHVWSGREHVCATTDDDQLWCWGSDGNAQVSAGVDRGNSQPCIVGQPCDYPRPTLAPAAAQHPSAVVAGNNYSCALSSGNAVCWGQNGDGVLGVNGTSGHGPTSVAPVGGWTELFGGDRGTCGMTSTTGGTPQCWGHTPVAGGSTPQPLADADVQGIHTVTIGDEFACAVSGTSRVCWGANNRGQIGNGMTTDVASPTVIDTDTLAVAARNSSICKINASDGKVLCWGQNNIGQAGVAPSSDVMTPAAVTDPSGALVACTRIKNGGDHSCALCGSAVLCWGEGSKTGRGPVSSAPGHAATAIAAPNGVLFSEISTTDDGGCALDTTGKLWCWGDSAHGQVGDGGQDRNIPTEVLR